MDKLTKRLVGRIGRLLALMIILLMTGCAGLSVVPEPQRIPLDAATAKDTYQMGQLQVNYDYQLSGAYLDIRGTVRYSFGYGSLSVWLRFLDGEGKILDQKIVYSSGYRTERYKKSDMSFGDRYTLPAGTTSFTFFSKTRRASGHR